MAHFAQLNDENIVTQVIVVTNDTIGNLEFPESEPVGVAFCKSLFGEDTNWVQTSYNSNFRHNYAAIGHTFDSNADAFITPKPYPSWILDTETYKWNPPIPRPTDGKVHIWNEETKSWDFTDVSTA